MEIVVWATCSYDTPEHIVKRKNVLYHCLIKPDGGMSFRYESRYRLKVCIWALKKLYDYMGIYGRMFVKPSPVA